MPNITQTDPIARKELHVFYVLDTSGSMAGAKISALNHAMEECTEALKDLARQNADADLRIAVLEFNSGCKWVTSNGPEALDDFEYEYLRSGGITDMGAALKELNSKLSRSAWLNSMVGALMPVIIFMSDGYATDDYKSSLEEVRKNKWFRRATKIGFAIGEDTQADAEMLSDVVGNSEAVIKTTDLELFQRLMKFVTVHSSMLISQSKTSDEIIPGLEVVQEAVKAENGKAETGGRSDSEYTPEPPAPTDGDSNDDWGETMKDW